MSIVDIVVSDLDATMTFYRHLGVEFEIDEHMPEHAGADLPNGVHLMLDTEAFRRKACAGWTSPGTGGGCRTVLSFGYEHPRDVDAVYTELTAAGYTGLQEPWDAFWGMRYATIADPDGNAIDLYATLTDNGDGSPR